MLCDLAVSRGEFLEAEAAAAGHRGGQGQNYDHIFTSLLTLLYHIIYPLLLILWAVASARHTLLCPCIVRRPS